MLHEKGLSMSSVTFIIKLKFKNIYGFLKLLSVNHNLWKIDILLPKILVFLM